MRNIIIKDYDIQYSSTLILLLKKFFPESNVYGPEMITGCSERDTMIISSDTEFLNLHSGYKSVLISDDPDDSQICCSRYSEITDFCRSISSLLSGSEPDRTGDSETLICCFTGNGRPEEISVKVMQEADKMLHQGLIPVIIEICPGYSLVLPKGRTSGIDTLSDLMVRIIDNTVSSSELGTYLYPLESGVLRFRPFSRTDDIFECCPDTLRKFIELLFDWNKRNLNIYSVLIVIHGVPFSMIYTAATLSGKLILINTKDDFRTAEFNNEISSLLKNLPDSCEKVVLYE